VLSFFILIDDPKPWVLGPRESSVVLMMNGDER